MEDNKFRKFTKEDLKVWDNFYEDFFVDILNGDYSLVDAREDLMSFFAIGEKDE